VKNKHRVVFGDARSMSRVDDSAVHLIVTSPPYWQLKDYGSSDQIGFDNSYEEYINNLNLAWSECNRVLHPGCRLCMNIGDQFARSVYYGRYKVIPIRTEIIRFCEAIGLDFMGSIIWQKVTTCNTSGGATIMGSFPHPRNGIVKIDYEFILLFKKHGLAPKVTKECKEQSKMTTEDWNSYFSGHWNFPGEKQKGHIAMFPEELPKRLIRMFSFKGETVLDPFLGSGTTTVAAMNLSRNSIGYEISEDFGPMIKEKIAKSNGLSAESDAVFMNDNSRACNEQLLNLPYIFNDPVKLVKKTDPRKIRFGSRIAKSENTERVFEKVKEVLSTTELKMTSGLIITLMGVKIRSAKRKEAIEFLNSKVKGRHVYLKFDPNVKGAGKKKKSAYLYLKNRTFVNAHLVKHGLAQVDKGHGITNKSLLRYCD